MLDIKIETIDEVTALEYLTHSDGNRPYHQQYTSELAARQTRGEWRTNGDSIRFDSNGILRDGQHRLKMIVQTGIAIEAIVIRGIDPDAFITMDVGKKRNLADVLSIQGEANPQILAGALFWIRRYLIGNMFQAGTSHEQHLDLLTKHPGTRDSVRFFGNLNKPAGYPGQPAITTATHYLFSQVDSLKANEMIERYVTGLELTGTDPVYRLREQIIGYKSSKMKPTPQQIFGIFCFAWIAHTTGRPKSNNFKLPLHQRERIRVTGFPGKLFLEGQLSLEENDEESET
ncbi:hypothetical protein ES703_76983 [subsurface metagenome]